MKTAEQWDEIAWRDHVVKYGGTVPFIRAIQADALRHAAQPTIELLSDVVHGPESAWNRWLYRRDEELIRLKSLIQ